MKTGSEYQEVTPLCCCEYIDINGERNHIMLSCCNCTELDSAVDSLICCRKKSVCVQLQAVCRVIQDRMRIPWLGGARLINTSTLAPILLTIVIFVVAAQGWVQMYLTCSCLISIILIPTERHSWLKLDLFLYTKVFYSTLGMIVVIYEYYVVPQLEITFSENMVFVVFMIISALAFYLTKLKSRSSNAGQFSEEPTWSKQCHTCNKSVHCTDFHSVWHGCCIGIHNRLWYIFSLTALMIAVFDCSYLTLTTMCRPYELVDDLILVPEDCDEVFVQWQYSICFVSGIFSFILSIALYFVLVREMIFVSIGLTLSEWKCLPLRQKLCLGVTSHRPNSKGFFLNWYQVLKRSYI